MLNPDAVKSARAKTGLTQQDVADMIGVTQEAYQRWEAGKRTPDRKQIPLLASALDVQPYELLAEADLAALKLAPVPDETSAEVFDITNHLPPERRRQLLKLAKALVDDSETG